MIHRIGDKEPDAGRAAFVAWNAEIAGKVTLGEGASVWYSATIRADLAPVSIGRMTNIQDGAVLHVDIDCPLAIGDRVTVGHNAVLHGCTVEDDCLIGMGAIVLNGARIGRGSVVGAGALVTERKSFPPGSVILGSPAKPVREVDEAMARHITENAESYFNLARQAAAENKSQPSP